MASSLPPPPLPFRRFQTHTQSNSIPFQIRKNPNLRFQAPISSSFSSSSPSSSAWEQEEIRWIREEQRWIREEQRWIRQESLWNSEREALLQEIAALKLRIQALELEKLPSSSVSDVVSNLASILQALTESESKLTLASSRIAEPMMLEEGQVKEMILEEIRVSVSGEEVKKEEQKKKNKKTLRKGFEGDDVREMQVCVLGN